MDCTVPLLSDDEPDTKDELDSNLEWDTVPVERNDPLKKLRNLPRFSTNDTDIPLDTGKSIAFCGDSN